MSHMDSCTKTISKDGRVEISRRKKGKKSKREKGGEGRIQRASNWASQPA